MSFSILLFENFYKSKDSTKIPDISSDAYVNVSVSLKDSTSIINPVFLLSSNQIGKVMISQHLFKFAYWQECTRYYFIDDIKQVGNTLFEIICSFDYLGTYRRQILASNQFIAYAYTSGNGLISDTRLVPKNTATISRATGVSVLPNTDPCTLVNIISENGTASKISGGISQYIFDSTYDFTSFLNKIFHMYENVDLELCLRLYMTGTTPDSVLSANYYPYTPTGLTTTNVYVGSYDSTYTASALTHQYETKSQSLVIPWNTNDMFKTSTYFKASLFLPYIGVIGLDIAQIANLTSIGIDYVFDNVNGSFACTVRGGSDILYTFEGNISSSLQFSTITNNPVQGYIDIASGTGKLLSGNVGGALSGVIEGVGEFTRADTSVSGSYNTRLESTAYPTTPILTMWYYEPQVALLDLAKVRGRILCKRDQLKNYTGFVQTENSHFEPNSITALSSEVENICNMLDNGIYIE